MFSVVPVRRPELALECDAIWLEPPTGFCGRALSLPSDSGPAVTWVARR